MKRILLPALALFAAPVTSPAAVYLTTDTDTFDLTPGSSFHVTLNLVVTAADQVLGLDYSWLASPGAEGGLTLLNRTTSGSPIVDGDEFSAYPFSGPQLLAPSSTNLGGLVSLESPFFGLVGAGSFTLGTYFFHTSRSLAPGVYGLSLSTATWLDADFNDRAFASLPGLTVNLATTVPEGGRVTVIAAALLVAIAWATRRRSTRVAPTSQTVS